VNRPGRFIEHLTGVQYALSLAFKSEPELAIDNVSQYKSRMPVRCVSRPRRHRYQREFRLPPLEGRGQSLAMNRRGIILSPGAAAGYRPQSESSDQAASSRHARS
jgi:hypothetical protein